ncbi:MAG: translation initiation factor IF-1 [Minisyncoccia bacterium]
MSKENIIVEGQVIETLPNLFFRVKLDDNKIILAHLSGKMRVNNIKVLLGDRVMVELSLYDKNKGRIIFRK